MTSEQFFAFPVHVDGDEALMAICLGLTTPAFGAMAGAIIGSLIGIENGHLIGAIGSTTATLISSAEDVKSRIDQTRSDLKKQRLLDLRDGKIQIDR